MSHTPDLHFVLLIVMIDASLLPLVLPLILLLSLPLLLSVLELDVGCVQLLPIWVFTMMQLCFGRQHVDHGARIQTCSVGETPRGHRCMVFT